MTATGWKASSVTPSISTSRSSNRSSLTWRRDSLRLKGTRRIMPTTFTSARAPPSVMVCRCMWSARWPTAATMSRTPPDYGVLRLLILTCFAGVCAGFFTW
ncbi:hypothetical protein J4732_04735 [Serratia marcescens]|uniref:Uncharacterized protein n=1 Tax=Serratia marcescens TaxID=615 RepID=A0A939NJH9_SERMA|nr:hypothetical protein [Serratia marcescens]